MPRRPRRMSNSGYMHVIVRGVGKQILFEDSMDFKHFLKRLELYSLETEVKICAYCLMENHVHLLVHSKSESLALFMKKIGVSYSGYYNKKYDRVGHLFQDRYLSEPVETENYLMTVFRYILRNPQKAGICNAADYKWSSYGLYENPPKFMDLVLIKTLIGDCKQYTEFVNVGTEDQCLEFETKHDDEWAKKELEACLNVSSGTRLKAFSVKDRNASLVKLKRRGLTVRQIERLTGINRNIIQKAGK